MKSRKRIYAEAGLYLAGWYDPLSIEAGHLYGYYERGGSKGSCWSGIVVMRPALDRGASKLAEPGAFQSALVELATVTERRIRIDRQAGLVYFPRWYGVHKIPLGRPTLLPTVRELDSIVQEVGFHDFVRERANELMKDPDFVEKVTTKFPEANEIITRILTCPKSEIIRAMEVKPVPIMESRPEREPVAVKIVKVKTVIPKPEPPNPETKKAMQARFDSWKSGVKG